MAKCFGVPIFKQNLSLNVESGVWAGFFYCFLRGVFGIPKRFHGRDKEMIAILFSRLTSTLSYLSRNGLRASWNFLGMSRDMRPYS
jgi:hypothetical protein